MNNFDELYQITINEAPLSSYLKTAAAAAGKGIVKGIAQLPGRAIQAAGSALNVAGKAYSAIGGKQGGALAQTIGSRVARSGKAIAIAPQALYKAIIRFGRGPKFNKYIKSYKQDIFSQYPWLSNQQKSAIQRSNNVIEINNELKHTITDKQLEELIVNFYDKNIKKDIEAKKQIENDASTTPVQNQPEKNKYGKLITPPLTIQQRTQAGLPMNPVTNKTPAHRTQR